MDYDQTNIAEVYDRGRGHGQAVVQQWMSVVAEYVDETKVHEILDLGCGTGRFSHALAVRFNAVVIGIDPSRKMLGQALISRSHDSISYVGARAEALPLKPNSIDMIFISMAFHHFSDPHLVAQECRRVLRQHGRLCMRTESSEKISMYPRVT